MIGSDQWRLGRGIFGFIIAFYALTAYAPGQEAQMPAAAPLNPEFVKFMKNINAYESSRVMLEGHGLGLIPSPVDLSHVTGNQIFKGILGTPATYDLRTTGKLTPIRDQGSCGSCWAFAAIGSLESKLLTAEPWDFSENNLKNRHGFDWRDCSGGNSEMAMAYLARWEGPVTETDDPYNVASGYSAPNLPVRKHLQEVLIIPDRADSLDNENIKQAVMTYGAVNTSMYINGIYWNSGTGAYYYSGTSDPNHAVDIVGWDDNYSNSNFRSLPPGNGAFIVRNSWGIGWGMNGYFYISYYDVLVGKINYVFNGAQSTAEYSRVYQYDPLGWTSGACYGSETAWFANVFAAVADEPLAAVSFYTVSPNSTYEIYVYTDVTSGPRSGSIAGSATGSINLAGYHTITLPPGISLNAGQKFSIVIRLTTPGNTCPIPVETQVIGYTSNATANAGESYTSSDGNGWSDLVSWWPNTNVCLKAFSAYPTPKPDLVVTEINAVPASPVAGQTVNITVSVHNQGTSAADAFKVDFYKSLISEPAGFQTGDFSCNSTVLAAGAATTCTGEVSYPAVGFYKMWAQVDTRQQISESLEGNNTLAQAITIADSPDLTISSLNGPSTVLPDVAFVLTDTTKNSGVVSAPATITGYYRSTDCTWSADDIFLPSRPVGALSPGASHTGSVSVTIPASIAGTVYVIAKADSSDILAESNEANNMSCKSYTFLPDLVIASLTGPATITAGTTITLTDTTKNSGTTPSPAASTSYYLSSDSIWSADDILLASRPVGALTAGATNTGSTSVTIPPSAAGTVYLIAKADGANVVTESKETNNTNSKSYTLRPDLAVASIAGPSTAVPGATITLTDVTQNLGKASAPATATSYYLSTNSTWSTDDVLLASRAVGYLAVGATNAGSVQVTIPGSASGVVYIIAGADSADVVEEISESNNTRYKSYTFKPNLAISSLTGPSKTSPGATIILTDITKNSGTTSAPATTTNYYLSMNNTWSADDTLLTSRAVQPLAAGATDAGSVFVTIPPSATGTIYIIAKADGANEVAESSETDNIKSKTYKFLPDLIVSSVTGPDIAAAGTSITFTDITKNSGVTSAPATSTSYYLSTNATWSADDVLLASRAVGPLAAGATSTGSVSTTTPTAGTYYIIVKADDSNATEESSKTNNTKYRQFVASP